MPSRLWLVRPVQSSGRRPALGQRARKKAGAEPQGTHQFTKHTWASDPIQSQSNTPQQVVQYRFGTDVSSQTLNAVCVSIGNPPPPPDAASAEGSSSGGAGGTAAETRAAARKRLEEEGKDANGFATFKQ